jgi:hypothetical protein
MKRTLALMLAAPIALACWIAPASAAENEAAQNDKASSIEVYKAGHDFVVAVYQPDSSAVLSIVEARHVKMDRLANGTRGPNMSDLIKKGRVKYTIRMGSEEMSKINSIGGSEAQSFARTGVGSAGNTKPGAKLTAQQKKVLFAKLRAARKAMGTVSKSLTASVGGPNDEETPMSAAKHGGANAITDR